MTTDEQRTPEWIKDKCGNVGGSRITSVLAKPLKGAKEAATRRNYKAELVCELLTGKAQEGFVSYDMKRGMELEPSAKIEYELRKNVCIVPTGFIMHPTVKRSGASPDGLVGDDGLVEFKCPNAANHMDYLTSGRVPTEYIPQMAWELACSGRKWVDFVSYHPDFPDHMQLFVIRYHRDDVLIAELEAEVTKFNEEIDEIIAKLPKAESVLA